MSAWLKVYPTILRHPKTIELGRSMGWNRFEAAGRLLAFWGWVLEYAPTGDIGKFNDEALCADVELNGTAAQKFISECVRIGWLDRVNRTLLIHDWPDYVRRYLRDSKFNEKPELWTRFCELYGTESSSTESPRKVRGNTAVEKRREEKKHTPGGNALTFPGFDLFWNAYPKHRRVAKPKCLTAWRSKGLESKSADIVAHVTALSQTADWTKDNGKFCPMSTTYLNQDRWEATLAPEVKPTAPRKATVCEY